MDQALAYVKEVVSELDNAYLMQPVTNEEIEAAVFQLGASKAPCPDGIKAHYTIAITRGCFVILRTSLGIEFFGKGCKLKINDFNFKHIDSDISVLQFTICENLANEFNDAVNEEETQAESTADEVSQPTIQVSSDKQSDMACNQTPMSQATNAVSVDSAEMT
ncbi:hypothetical protein K1719_012311 [Acacia pycnantha]|nr:hypothetical protein K1719_012311 [Acacia pycnantha]